MYPYIHITLPSYAVMAFIGGFFALVFIFFRLEKYDIEFSDFLRLFILAVIGGIIGSKVLFALTQIPWLIDNFTLNNLLILIPQSGYVYYGGLFGVLFALWLATKKDSEKQHKIMLLVIPAIPLFHFFGRLGCMMAGCCYGIKINTHIQIGFLEFGRVPVQLIEAGYELFLFLLFIVLEKFVSSLYSLENYLVLYAAFRFVIEFYRGDKVRGLWLLGLSTAQIISILIIATVIIRKLSRNREKYQRRYYGK